MADMLTQDQVLEKMHEITEKAQKSGGGQRALEDAYAFFLENYRDRVNLEDVRAFFGDNMSVDQIKAQYLPENGYVYSDDFNEDAWDISVPGARPPVVRNVGTFNTPDEAWDSLMDRYSQGATESPFVEPLSAFELENLSFTPPTDPAKDFRNIQMDNYGTIQDLIEEGKIAQGLYDPINFPQRDITRATPVVSRGLDQFGRPTSAITMGQTTATGTGEDIGKLTTRAQFPSIGMGINPDGTGTATTGTLDTTGNIVATGADEVTTFTSPATVTSTVDANVVNTNNPGSDVTVNETTVTPTAVTTDCWNASGDKQVVAGKVCPAAFPLYTPPVVTNPCPPGTVLAGQPIPADGNCNPQVQPPTACPEGSVLAGQPIPADGNCNPVKPPTPCPEGSVLAGQPIPADGNCNPVKPPTACPQGQIRGADGNCRDMNNAELVAQIVKDTEDELIATYGPNFTEAQKAAAIEKGKAKLVAAAMGSVEAGGTGFSVTEMSQGAQMSGANQLLDLDPSAGAGGAGIDSSSEDVFNVVTNEYSDTGAFGTVGDTAGVFVDDFTGNALAQQQSAITETDYSGASAPGWTDPNLTQGIGVAPGSEPIQNGPGGIPAGVQKMHADLDTVQLGPGSNINYYKYQGPDGQWLYKAVEGMGRTQWDIDITKEEYDAAMAGTPTDKPGVDAGDDFVPSLATGVDKGLFVPGGPAHQKIAELPPGVGHTKVLPHQTPEDDFIVYNTSPYVSVDETFIPGGKFGASPGEVDYQWGAAAQGLAEGDSSFMLGGPETTTYGSAGDDSNIPFGVGGYFGFNQGGGVTQPTDAYQEFTMSVSMGPDEIAMQKRQEGVQKMMNTRAGIMPNQKMLSALDRIMGRNQNG